MPEPCRGEVHLSSCELPPASIPSTALRAPRSSHFFPKLGHRTSRSLLSSLCSQLLSPPKFHRHPSKTHCRRSSATMASTLPDLLLEKKLLSS
uniref:Uncharacterized protein n=1 Tax=Arundo donax TaxID=35708 RepID=A0A0A8YWV3_ARUDO